jgi:23S rRNA (adenine2503-C2)-methyltransferase
MPINKKYNLKQVLESVDNYIKKTNRRVMLEYIMIKDVNDSDKCAKELAKIAKRKLCFVNLILYNKSGERSDPSPLFRPSEPARVKKFKEILEKSGVEVTQRYRFGEKMAAACGQLAGGVK